ncbi:hypothetical protein V2H45_06940 [Tumidithrix elongata RA019]|uniref:Uncharacterized protein n=1 Tax=Tumidithrix elongata BACA0141 TaxID=2716417 RepID=A0AAW9Q0U6_9CYAN|nr:hypothetical protein [Tumidithrix elongata RA019]
MLKYFLTAAAGVAIGLGAGYFLFHDPKLTAKIDKPIPIVVKPEGGLEAPLSVKSLEFKQKGFTVVQENGVSNYFTYLHGLTIVIKIPK